MHDAWFNSADSGVSVPTNIPYVFPDMYTIDPYSNEPVVNPNTSLLTIVDNETGWNTRSAKRSSSGLHRKPKPLTRC